MISTASLVLLVLLGISALSFLAVPELRRSPILQEVRLFLYLLGDTQQAANGHGKAPATQLVLHNPMGVAEDREGNLYVEDRGRWFGLAAIWKIGPDGMAELLVGSGHRGPVVTGTEALRSDLGSPEGLSIDDAGRLYFADSVNHVVVRVDSDGRVSRLAGTGVPGFSGDGGPAVEAALNLPYDVRVDSRGNVYIADYGNNRVRMISPDGLIRTVAGTGEYGYSGDEGPATAAQLNGPYGLFVDDEDGLLIADTYNHEIRRVDRSGIITTIAGSRRQGFSGDGGPATAAALDGPQALYVDAAGRTYIDDEHNHAIRIVAPDGRISTLIGTGAPGFRADGPIGTDAQLDDPEYLLVRHDGTVVISERGNGRIIAIEPNGKVHTLAGTRKK